VAEHAVLDVLDGRKNSREFLPNPAKTIQLFGIGFLLILV
jgi:hypothetical protein